LLIVARAELVMNSRCEDYSLGERRKVLAQVTCMVYLVTVPTTRHSTMNLIKIISG
jgi:hypothetical protein